MYIRFHLKKEHAPVFMCNKNMKYSTEVYICNGHFVELGTSLLEITQSLFALEQTFILGAMALCKKKE